MNPASSDENTRAAKAPSRIAFIRASWHEEIVGQCQRGFIGELENAGYPESMVELFEVPGAFEIPLLAKMLAKSGKYSAIVGCALVVDGGIYRHEFVAQAVISGLMQVQLECEVPLLSAVLTPHHFHEHEEHKRYFQQHFVIKGQEVARACLRTIDNLASARTASDSRGR
jgi:6,7-dimethyl-8-ribityllumazine synthase